MSGMPTFAEIKKAISDIATAFEAYKETNDERIKAVQSGNTSLAAELDAKLAKIEKSVSDLVDLRKTLELEQKLQRERLEDLEARASQPGRTPQKKRADEYKAAFVDWVRNKGQSPNDEQKLQDLQRKMWEAKDVTIGTPAGGGFAVPEEIRREIERLELRFSPVRRLVKVVTVGTSDYKALVSLRGSSSGWVGELGPRPATLTPRLREVTPTQGELYAYPQASEWSLDDIFFNVEQWLAEEVAAEFSQEEGIAVISGNGVTKPTGMLNTTPVLTPDFASPLRAAAAYQYIDSPGTPAQVTADPLITAVYTLNSMYRANATWIMNSLTMGAVRRLKASDGHYLWQPGLAMGQPERLLGYPHETWENMPDVATNAFPIAIGDWSRAYILVDRVGLRITRDNVTNIGFVRFYVRRREGGHVYNNDAAKFIRTT
jgi:HK97 family phage major capsid protein